MGLGLTLKEILERKKSLMSKKETKKKTKKLKPGSKDGRPLVEIDWEQFDKLCALQCTRVEIAGYFNCSPATISRACQREQGMTFDEYYGIKASAGKISLRRAQIKYAEKGNSQLLIWLGKQNLGQREKHEIEHTGDAFQELLTKIDGKTKKVGESVMDNE